MDLDLNLIWFVLVGFLLAGYAVLDGFDLGVGVLSLFARSEEEKRIYLNAIGPVWDGNEVWLLTAGGALFAAFPIVYATSFSAMYLALMLVLVALLARAASFEFRGKSANPGWRRFWDWSFGLGSLVAALLYGVAVGNMVRGIPLDASGAFTARFPASFFGLLNPYSLLVGLVTLTVFVLQGATYMCLKTDGELLERMQGWVRRSWMGFVVLFGMLAVATFFAAPHAIAGPANPLFWILLVVLAGALVTIPIASAAGRSGRAFVASSGLIVAMIGVAAVGMFPRLVVSSLDLANSLTAYNAASTPKTQGVMLIMTLIGMPIVIAYTAFVYTVFKGKVVLGPDSY